MIILEGILLLTDARLRESMNFSIFVDTPLDICLMRRIKRDVNERSFRASRPEALRRQGKTRLSLNGTQFTRLIQKTD